MSIVRTTDRPHPPLLGMMHFSLRSYDGKVIDTDGHDISSESDYESDGASQAAEMAKPFIEKATLWPSQSGG